jgi:GXGXG motif
MTGGVVVVVVVLGEVGRNVGAGMTGGLGYFLDEDDRFIAKINPEIVKWQRVQTAAGEKQLKDLITAHGAKTGSQKAQEILSRSLIAKVELEKSGIRGFVELLSRNYSISLFEFTSNKPQKCQPLLSWRIEKCENITVGGESIEMVLPMAFGSGNKEEIADKFDRFGCLPLEARNMPPNHMKLSKGKSDNGTYRGDLP